MIVLWHHKHSVVYVPYYTVQWGLCAGVCAPQILLTSKGISLNPMTSLYYIAPTCFAFLTIPWYFNEYARLSETEGGFFADPDFLTFGLNCLCAFALNLAVFLLIGKTSALTMNVAGGCQCSTV